MPGNRRQVPILHRDADFLLRALQPDDFVRTSRYENANREHLAPWEPLRDPGYFSVDNARARTLLQVASMDDGEVLGRCSYTNIVRGVFQACHLGFSLAAAAQGRGLMARALRVANRYCFEQLGLHRIMASHLPRNARSERLLESLGFEREGYARAYLKIAGVWEDHVLRALVDAPR
ncbi:GNAT family N-acetyltransferase [Pseudomonas aeruginosa]|uniref:GNAT family N-acetyltransferase n=1 Tax=Pseudomonas aeruginosa TaxID=287 RepID=UPI001DC83DB7|nr:GNAT family N-acetyltransferase [Pseudomonas aeruginosa]MBX5562888.1 GNAT family N-acetyltransferase [Pseudomonas aeruginosa]MBX5640009.1 GNAT family N-acetyltransferase [Pseudomonas aeruginosa]MBX5878875.1 GNAT family N-acetyltransferase [Pseudomonas aeruginosa]MBX5926813.1 GNAT family N-acetyltransferase [Pseudomonas aeruginosa]